MTDVLIYAALAAVMDDCKSVAKRDRNEHQKFLFRGIDAVVNAVGPILRKHSVVVVPNVETVSYDHVSTSTNKPATACRVVVTYTFWATDGSSVAATVAAEAWDHGDKAAPKAMSVAFRTALLQALALPTDEADPDSQTYSHADAPAAPPTTTTRMSRGTASADKPITPAQSARMFALFGERGITDRDVRLAGIAKVIGRDIASSKDMTTHEASLVIDTLAPPHEPPEEQ